MRIMQVTGNSDYRKNQTSFGMVLNLTPKAEKMFDPEELATLRASVAHIKANGKEIFVKGKVRSVKDGSISLSASVENDNASVRGIIVSHVRQKGTYDDDFFHRTFGSSTNFALKRIREALSLLVDNPKMS